MSTTTRTPKKANPARAAVAALIGTTLEWYDFTLFTLYSALIFQQIFFVDSSPAVATIQSLGIFAAGFLARPIGALVFGRIGDRLGRKTVLVGTLLVMGIATTAIGLLPTHAQIGASAPILLLVLRLAQGFAAGAEVGTAITVSAEYARPERRGLWAAAPAMGNFAGLILSALAFRLVVGLPQEDLMTWGWRVPFLAGFVVVIVGIIVRLGLEETPAFVAKKAAGIVERTTLIQVFRTSWKPMVLLGIVYFCGNGLSYFFQALAASYAAGTLGLAPIDVSNGTLFGAIGGFVTVALYGALSDRIGRRPVMIAGFVWAVIAAAILFLLVGHGNAIGFLVVMFIALALSNAGVNAGVNGWGTEIFTTEGRITGMTLSREVAGSLGGGVIPLIGVSLIASAGGAAPYYLLGLAGGLALIGIVVVALVRETRGRATDMDHASDSAEDVRQAAPVA
ncbi:MFS family permease [Microbacterium resistens]|uniref:MFS family permease n=1 Tax=Microbacterium resistens TaxID=156977 RepID=A0ABU1SDD8_9MICO|nr:MFS transporter [Microbacterium resistens]MDR6867602.1 MFS family permease [Microbacterium resistens]